MALITCPECDNQISDKAEACPHCGFPLQDPRESSSRAAPQAQLSPEALAFIEKEKRVSYVMAELKKKNYSNVHTKYRNARDTGKQDDYQMYWYHGIVVHHEKDKDITVRTSTSTGRTTRGTQYVTGVSTHVDTQQYDFVTVRFENGSEYTYRFEEMNLKNMKEGTPVSLGFMHIRHGHKADENVEITKTSEIGLTWRKNFQPIAIVAHPVVQGNKGYSNCYYAGRHDFSKIITSSGLGVWHFVWLIGFPAVWAAAFEFKLEFEIAVGMWAALFGFVTLKKYMITRRVEKHSIAFHNWICDSMQDLLKLST